MDTQPNLRALIIKHYQDGWTYRRIADATGTPRSTVSDIVKAYRETGSSSPQRRGRAATNVKVSPRTERRLRVVSNANPRMTARQLQEEVGGSLSQAHVSTV